jgi:hypothetical protein
LVLALLGFAVAVASSRIEVSVLGAGTAPVWPGSGLSLLWLGLICCIIVSLDAFGRGSVTAASVAVVTTVILAVPLLGAGLAGISAVGPAPGRIVPAVVEAESVSNPRVGTLMLVPASSAVGEDDRVSAVLQRGVGSTLDDQSTLAATSQQLSEADAQLAMLAGNLASRSGYDPSADLGDLSIGFVVLADADPQDESQLALHKRVSSALDGSDRVTAVGASSSGLLWRVASAVEPLPAPSASASKLSGAVLGVQGVIIFLTMLLAIPTTRRRRRLISSAGPVEAPATTFDEEEHA